MENAYHEGIVKSIGVSNFNEHLYNKIINNCEIFPAINQVEAHAFFQQQELNRLLNEKGTIMEAWSPLTAGRKDFFNNPILVEIAYKYNKSVAQIALKFLLEKKLVIIPKSSNKSRMKENYRTL